MTETVIMPQLGETVAEGKILGWFKSVGDEVKEGDPLCEVETDKANSEIEVPADGTLTEIRGELGAEYKVGDVIAVIDAG
jgi:pyruvate/2-oxoglutarate dehydrogenase complex dihydrolipoamide acyltransferase (E2) component